MSPSASAFIAMPCSTRPGPDGAPIHFDRIRAELVTPALAAAGCRLLCTGAEHGAGDIRAERFQALLLADVVVVDLTIDDAGLLYELGVRHALRARGAVLLQGPRATQPFDRVTDGKLIYRLKDGAPDPAWLEDDIAALVALLRATLEASSGLAVNPVYRGLDHLREAPWRDLLLAQRTGFSLAQQRRQGRIEAARANERPGDIVVLADEAPTRALWIEGRRAAGEALLQLGQALYALEQFDAVLAIEPGDPRSRAWRVRCLGRLGRLVQAREEAAALLREHPAEADAGVLAGRIETAHWASLWRAEGGTPASWQAAAAAQLDGLDAAIRPFHQAFVADPAQHVAGVAALRLQLVARHLSGAVDPTLIDHLAGGARWAALAAQQRVPTDPAARASLAELSLLVEPRADVQREFAAAVAAAAGDRIALASMRESLGLLRDLAFRPVETAAALAIVEAGLARRVPHHVPRQVLLFSGHRVDAPDRPVPRFPAARVPQAAAAIERALDALDAGPADLAITQGACGGDLLFAQACQARGVRLRLMQPLPEPEFVERSVLDCDGGPAWHARYLEVRSRLVEPLRSIDDELGPAPDGVDPMERCNRWMLAAALAEGAERLRFICLWDGGGADGPGGTRHSVEEVQRRTGRITWLDTRDLFKD